MSSELSHRPPSWRDRFDHIPGRARPRKVRNGALFVLFCLIFCWVIYTRPTILPKKGTKLTAEFGYASNLYPGRTPVRVHGVDVGLVKKVERAPSGRGVRVEMQIDKGRGVHLRQDATMSVRWKTLLGRNMYMDLNPGSPSAPAMTGNFIPRSRTSNQVELDTALEPLDATGRGALKTLIREFDGAFADPAATQGTLDNAAAAMRPLARGMKGLRGTTPGADLPNVVTTTSKAMAGLANDETALGGLIDSGDVALGVTAARRAELASTLQDAPAAMRETRATMTRLVGTLDAADPLADKLMPGAKKLDGSLATTQRTLAVAVPLLHDLRPTLRSLKPAVRDLGAAATTGTPSFASLNNVMKRTQDEFIPWLKDRDSETHFVNYQVIGPAVAGASSALSQGDRYQVLANFEGGAGEDLPVSSPCKVFIGDNRKSLDKKIQCELMTRSLVAIFRGTTPDRVKIADSAVPQSALSKYLKSDAVLKWGVLGRRPQLTAFGKGK